MLRLDLRVRGHVCLAFSIELDNIELDVNLLADAVILLATRCRARHNILTISCDNRIYFYIHL